MTCPPDSSDGRERLGAYGPRAFVQLLEHALEQRLVNAALGVVLVEGRSQDRRLRPRGENGPFEQLQPGGVEQPGEVGQIDVPECHPVLQPPPRLTCKGVHEVSRPPFCYVREGEGQWSPDSNRSTRKSGAC